MDLEAVIKSAAGAASRKTKIQASRGASRLWLGMRTAGMARLPWIPGFWSLLAADLITAWITFPGGYATSGLIKFLEFSKPLMVAYDSMSPRKAQNQLSIFCDPPLTKST